LPIGKPTPFALPNNDLSLGNPCQSFLLKLNAYLGILKHANSYKLVKKATTVLIKRFYCFFA
jgi:hypothetical protein